MNPLKDTKQLPEDDSKHDSKHDKARSLEQAKLDLLSLISHELRTPLTSVLNSLRMLKEESVGLSDAERAKLLDLGLRNAERLNTTLLELLDLSKLVTGRLVCKLQEVHLESLVLSQIEKLKKHPDFRRFLFEKKIRSLPVILGDPARLPFVFSALVENAFKFSPKDSKIFMSVHTTSKNLIFEVENIATLRTKKNPKKIFSQSEKLLNRTYEGVGGSLALCAEILRQHGGRLEIQHKKDRFKAQIFLPILDSHSALLKALEARMYALKLELGALLFVVIECNKRQEMTFSSAVRKALFRASDSIYHLADSEQLVVLMDDCQKKDSEAFLKRLFQTLPTSINKLKIGFSSAPEDSFDPQELFKIAQQNIKFRSKIKVKSKK